MNDMKIVNMVSTTRLGEFFDLIDVADILGIDYHPEQFPGMAYRIENPKVCVLLFRSGRAVATGAKSIEDAQAVCLIFSSGKCVITGNTSLEDAENAVKALEAELKDL